MDIVVAVIAFFLIFGLFLYLWILGRKISRDKYWGTDENTVIHTLGMEEIPIEYEARIIEMDGKYHWRLTNTAGDVIAESARGYATKVACHRAFSRTQTALGTAKFINE